VDLPLGALLDPLVEFFDLQWRQAIAFWGHLFVGIGAFYAAEELGFGGLVGDDGAVAGFELGEGDFWVVEAQAGLGLIRTVTFVAILGKDGADVAVEIDWGGRGGGGGSAEQERTDEEGWDRLSHMSHYT
jgi:hypothetical protein